MGLTVQSEHAFDEQQLDELVAAAQAGDEAALRDVIAWAMDYLFPAVLSMLYERRRQGAYITETLHTGGADAVERLQDDAWTITHSACCRIALRIDTFRGRNAFGRKTRFSTWAYAVAQNELRTLMRNRWRERKRYGGSRDEWENPSAEGPFAAARQEFVAALTASDAEVNPTPEYSALERVESERLREALHHAPLTPEQREAVVLFHGYGYPQARIAQLTGVQIGTVKKRIFDGLRKLRTYMAAASGPPSASKAAPKTVAARASGSSSKAVSDKPRRSGQDPSAVPPKRQRRDGR